MDISLDYINQVIARNDGRKGAGAGKAPASSDIDPKLQATTGAFRPQDIAALQEQKRYWTEAIEDKKQQQAQQQAYQQALAQHRQDMAQINQRERLQTAIKSGNRAQQYDRVQEYLANNENARKLWNLEHGMNTNQNAAAQRMRDAQALRGQMSGAELSAYEAAAEAYRQYGGLYAAGQTLKDLIQGSLTNAAGNLITTVQAAKQDWDERTEALESVYEQPRSANPLEAYGQITNNYRDALKRQEEQRAPENTYNETLSGLELARKGSEQVQRGGAALTGGGKMVYDLAGSVVSNAPAMALAAIPGVGPAASLGTLGAQAAGGKIDELSARGIGNREALGRGLVSGVIESATEVLPVSNWTKIIQQGGKSALRNIATQAFGEATEEGVSYIANYIADKMANDPEAEFSLQDLAYSAAMGAASGGIYGAAGTGINRAVNRVRSAGQNTAQQSAQNQPGGQGTAPKAGDSHQDAATMQQSTTNAARAQQDQLLSTAQQETGSSENSAAENPLTQLVPGGRQAQRAAETQQNTVNAVQTRQDGLNAVQGNPLNQLFPGGTKAQQTATPSMQAAVAQVQQNTANAAQAQQEVVRTSAEQVQQWAEENESFSPEMRTLAAQNYQPGGNAALYETAVQNFYDAGRSGALSYEQAMDLNENRAAVLQQDDVLRRAWDLGRREAQAVQDAPGAGTVEGQVQYESGVEPGAVLDDTVLQAAARKLGVNIKVVQELTDDAGGKANGRWAAAMSEIALGENSSNAYQTLAHELTHYMGQTMREVLTGQKGTMERLRDFGTKPAELGDKVTWGTLWNACEAEAKAKGLEAGTDKFNQYCADRLSEIVDKTQVVDSVLHRSQLMRNQNGAVKMATAFFAEPTKSYNMLAEALTNAAHGGKDAKWRLARVAATSVISILGTAAAASLVDALRVMQDEDRDKDYGERYLENLWQNFLSNVMPLNYIPLAKDILTLVDGYDVTRQDMELFGDLVDAVGAISKGLKGDISPYRLCYQIATAVSSLTGLPVSNVLRDTKSAYDMLTDMQDPLRLDRTLNRAPDDYSYIDLYNQVKAAGGNKDEFKALYQGETYSEMLGTPEAAAVDAWVQKLAQNSATTDADGNRKENAAVLPKHLDNEISYTDGDGVEHKVVLQGPDYLDYAKTVQQSTVNLLNEYMHGQGKTASTAEQAAYVKMAKEYAQELAREQVIPGYEIESWVQTVETLSGGRNVGGMIAARQIVSQTEGDKDENGKTITGSAEVKAVGRLQDELGYTEPEARTLYAQLKGRAGDTYLQLYEDVKGDKEQEEELSALYVMTGEEARYADMLQDSGAKKLDEHLRALSETQGKEVLPDRVENSFKVGDTEVELDGKQYVAYAKKRTETAYNILNELIPYMGNYTQKEQAGFVLYVEKYAEELAKASVSDFELSNWVEEVQELAGGDNAALYNYIMAKELIAVAQGKKDANGNTIRGTKKAAALRNLKNAGYSDYMAQQMYKLFA